MASDKRRDAATALTGAAALAGGGKLRHAGVTRAVQGGKYPKVHLAAILKPRAHGRYLYGGGTLLGLTGAAATAQGLTNLVRTEKRDKQPLWREGIGGTKDALKGRSESLRTSQPADLRATTLGVGAAAGGLGAMAARLALRKHPAVKPWLSPVAGGIAATASLPATAAVVRRNHPDYQVTPTGVRRKKDLLKKPSTQSFTARTMPRSLRADVGKAAGGVAAHFVYAQGPDDRRGWSSHTGSHTQATSGLAIDSDKRLGRKGRMVVVGAHQATADRPTARIGGAGIYGKIPLRRGKQWARDMQLDGEYAHAAAGGINPIRNVEGDLLRARRQYLAPRVAGAVGGAAALGGLTYAANRRKQKVRKEDYLGARTSYRTQRAAVTAAGGVPVVGPLAQARQAARYAPPGQERKTAARQFAYGPLAGTAAGVGGAYAGASLAAGSARVAQHAENLVAAKTKAGNALRRKVGMKPAKASVEAATSGWKASRAAKPLFGSKARMAGAAVGFAGAKAVTGLAGGQAAISASQRDQAAYNARHRIAKLDPLGTKTKREQHQLARTKRTNATLSVLGGTAGLTGLALLPTKHKAGAVYASTVGGGIGGLNALIGAKVQRKEAKHIDPVKKIALPDGSKAWGFRRMVVNSDPGKPLVAWPKSDLVASPKRLKRSDYKATGREVGKAYLPELEWDGPRRAKHASHGIVRVHAYHGRQGEHDMFTVLKGGQRILAPRHALTFLKGVAKRAGVEITGSKEEHKRLVAQYGDRGPLPAGLDRDTKMRAYEARYVHAGGDKSEKWNRRANVAEGSRNAALATGTAGLAGLAALKHPKVARKLAKHPRLGHRLDATALTAGAIGGASEIYGEYARHRRASYANSPGGVARSALTRMRSYTPQD